MSEGFADAMLGLLGKKVQAFWEADPELTFGIGRVVRESPLGTLVRISPKHGVDFWWRADLCEVLDEPEEKPSWKRGLERIEQGEKRERERRNPRPGIRVDLKVTFPFDFKKLMDTVGELFNPHPFSERYADAMGEGDEEQWEVFV